MKYVLTQRLLEREKGKELPCLSHQSPLFLRQLAPHRLNTAHLEQSTATATNGIHFSRNRFIITIRGDTFDLAEM